MEPRPENRILSSLIIFSELYDNKKDIYEVIREFIYEILRITRLFKFNLTQITKEVNDWFDFDIPEAVIKTALRKTDFKKIDGNYLVEKLPNQELDLITRKKGDEKTNSEIFSNLIKFVENKKGNKLSVEEQDRLVNSFCSFLIDGSNITDSIEFVSGFIISNKENKDFNDQLTKIREGLILYSGIRYGINLGQLGSWTNRLTIFIDTEILFHCCGLNGEVFKAIFIEFFKFVQEINSNEKSKIIKLEYFREVKTEIDDFFSAAESILEGKGALNPHNTAMLSVLSGCRTRSDIINKKTDFFEVLKSYGIFETKEQIKFSDADQQNNIISKDLLELLNGRYKCDISENLTFINYIYVLRQGKNGPNLEDVNYILLTGNSTTINLALCDEIRRNGEISSATSLDWMINRFWFKLNKGLGDGHFPKSVNIIPRAQIVLASLINSNIGIKFDNLKYDISQGKITAEQAQERAIALRRQATKPEEINIDSIPQILDILKEDSLEKYILEQQKIKNDSETIGQENQKLKQELDVTKNDLGQAFKRISLLETVIINSRIENLKFLVTEKEKQVDDLIKIEKKFSKEANRIFAFHVVQIVLGMVIFYEIAIYLFTAYKATWISIVLSALSTLFPFIYLLVKGKKWDLVQTYNEAKNNTLLSTFKKRSYIPSTLVMKKKELNDLQIELSEIVKGKLVK